jgi:hypothetical protein
LSFSLLGAKRLLCARRNCSSGNPFAQLPVACLEFADMGLGGQRQSGEVVFVHAPTIAMYFVRWVYGNL